jgi:hypothetical protein
VLHFSILLLTMACGGEDVTNPTCESDPSLCPAEENTTAEYIEGLPSWEQFASPDTTFQNTLDVAADTLPLQEEIVDSVPVFGPSGVEDVLTNVRYVCQARPYTMSDAPERIVMFDPNRSVLYAGALIQGKSRKELGSLLPLTISQRAPIRVSIPDLPTGANFREIVPTQGAVESARGDMIGNAVADNLSTPSSSTFQMTTYHSEQSMAISASLSGRYLGFEATASGSVARSLSQTTVTAHFYERMYTVVVEPPADGFFSDEFTDAVLQTHISAGRIGPDNLPVYVSEIVYGRMMMFSITSTASESDIRAAMNASYNTFTGSASGTINTKHEAVLEQSEIAITAVGGDGDAAAAMIRTGDWSQYFASSAALSQAVPLSYTFTNLGDGSIAAVTEATSYNIDECQPKPLIPGTFDFAPRQDLSVPVSPGYRTLFGDVNGDGREDMVFSYVSGSTNEIAVALAQADGTFGVQAAQDATVTPPEGWSLFDHSAVGDFDGDGDDDVMWNRLDTENSFYVALSNGDGTFTWGARQGRGSGGWSFYEVHVADLDNADGDDLLWNGINSGTNRTYVGMAVGDGTFDLTLSAADQSGTSSWSGTDFMIGDVTGDGFVDLIHSRTLSSDNANWVSVAKGDGTFDMTDNAFTNYGSIGWANYEPLLGDVNGDQRTDLFWINYMAVDIPIHRAIGNVDGRFTKLNWQNVPDSADGAGPYEVRTGDVDADGDSDFIMVDLDSSNNRPNATNRARVWVGLGTVDQVGTRFDFTPVDQLHPAQEVWGQYRVHVMDVNGDDKADLVLHWNSSPHQVYVGLAK